MPLCGPPSGDPILRVAESLKYYHIVFVVDSLSSMDGRDRKPLPNTPISDRLRLVCNNRYGAVLSALYGFLKSQEGGRTPNQHGRTGVEHTTRSDAYSVLTFTTTPNVLVTNDASSTTEQLIENLISSRPGGGTSFSAAIEKARDLIETNWRDKRMPVVIFLSDGECSVPEMDVRSLSQITPLAFYTISFGTEAHSNSLQIMACIAHEVYATSNGPGRADTTNPCAYMNAIDLIQLAQTFLDISHSLQKPRAALIGSANNRLLLWG
ncbi:unnamed protein product [Rhizoctonia solani]|uniref:VWFA domain-containing protein n=1 Tax=Rhizoctonia solani TaxID=456999 RepID=A0A8H3B6Q3_9AGAM|nr:unnamed protein product [Rhizoctonia solani]